MRIMNATEMFQKTFELSSMLEASVPVDQREQSD